MISSLKLKFSAQDEQLRLKKILIFLGLGLILEILHMS